MKRTKVLAVLACGLLAIAEVGCGAFNGATNNLQSLSLNVALVNGLAPSSQTGNFALQGTGGTIQLQAFGNYSDGKSIDLSNKVAYTVIVDPASDVDDGGNGTLLPPCQPPSCPVGNPGSYTSGTLEYDSTGLITAVEPEECSYEEDTTFVTGQYEVTVSYQGFTSEPVFVPVASATEPDDTSCGGIGSFTLAASPSSLSISPGSTGESAISVTATGGFNGAVTLTASTPSGITATFNPPQIQPGGSSVLTLTVGSGVAANSYIANVTGTSGTVTSATPITVTVP